MAWPPVIPPATRANSTTQLDNHPGDHNAISKALTDLTTKVQSNSDALAVVPWITLPMAAGWIPYGPPYSAPQYRKVGDIVQLRGVGKLSGAQVNIPAVFTTALPAAYCPPAAVQFVALMGATLLNLEVTTAGIITIAAGQGVTQVAYVSMWTGCQWSVTP